MKKITSLLILTTVMMTLMLSGCKKGENDPFFSLKSRTGRLSQEWTLSEENITTVSKSSWSGTTYTTTRTYSYDGTNETVTTTTSSGGNSTTNTSTYTYSLIYSFDKDGTYTITEIVDGEKTVTEGTWMWVEGNKDIDLKNKEAIMLTVTKITYSDGEVTTYTGVSYLHGVILLDELSGDRLVMKYDYSNVDSDGDTYTKTGTKTFEKK